MEEGTPRVSVVIPVYNVEPYLERCLESVTGQTYGNLEIILVDDGSTDRSGAICDRWAEADSRIKVVHKKNAGLGMARNTGLGHCTGDYLTFVDSDDYIEAGMIEKLVAGIQTQQGQLCCCGFHKLLEDGLHRSGKPPEKQVYEGREEIRTFMRQVLGPPPEVTDRGFAGTNICGNLYDMSLLADGRIRFLREQDILCEDLFFNLSVLKRVDRVVIVPDYLYNYCVNGSSLTQSYREDRFVRSKYMRKLLKRELKEELAEDPCLRQHLDRNYLDYLVGCMKVEVQSRNKIGKKRCREELGQMIRDPATQRILRRYPVRRMEPKQRILFSLVRHRWTEAVYWLFRLRYSM